MDELEEDLDDYREYIHAEADGAGRPLTPEEFQGNAAGTGGPLAGPGEGVPGEDGGGVEAPEGGPPEGKDGDSGQWVEVATGGADPLEGGVPREAGAATEPRGEEEPVPGPSGLGQRKGPAVPRQERSIGAPAQIAREMCGWNQSRGGLQPREPSGGHCWLTHC